MKVFLIGMPGSGKSTLGKQLALALKYPFIDLDAEIEKREGRPISSIFAAEGEAYFRKVESAVLASFATTKSDAVIATGGGAPCFHKGIDVINKSGISIFLEVTVAELIGRVENNKHRPLLQASDREGLRTKLEKTLNDRLPFYRQASITVQGSDVDQVVSELRKLL